jgi:hypothetical protein
MNSLYNEGMDGEFAALSKIMNFSINGGVPRALDDHCRARWTYQTDRRSCYFLGGVEVAISSVGSKCKATLILSRSVRPAAIN